jgi:hypothetical protein
MDDTKYDNKDDVLPLTDVIFGEKQRVLDLQVRTYLSDETKCQISSNSHQSYDAP